VGSLISVGAIYNELLQNHPEFLGRNGFSAPEAT
jgi:hypothetical protein